MKNNEELFNMSAKLMAKTIIDNNIDSETIKFQNELLRILIERFSEVSKKESELDGTLKLKFVSRYFSKKDKGFNEIRELIKSGWFDYQASEYCIYLTNIENGAYDSSFEITWDYRNYFESLILNRFEAISESIKDFDILPIDYQREILSSFKNNIEKYRKKYSQEENIRICLEEGHDFLQWKHFKRASADGEGKHDVWRHVCSRCKFSEEVEVEPQELIEARNAEKKRARIKKLEEELRKLREE